MNLIEISEKYLISLAEGIPNEALRETTLEAIPDLSYGFGGSEGHHRFKGGLVVHTAEVLAIGLTILHRHFEPRECNYIAGVVFHDYCKLDEYEAGEDGIIRKPYRNLIGHVSGSHAHFVGQCYKHGVDRETRQQIEHIILAQHGRQEWGSPRDPISLEAHVLHYADMLSSRFGATSPDDAGNTIMGIYFPK